MLKEQSNNKRIAKNSIFLYIRMAIMTFISFYTSRVILNVLGITDYGVYSVVAGIAVMFSFFNNALYQSTQRFLSYEMGNRDLGSVRRTFSMCVNCHILIAIIILIISEIVGVWFLNTNLKIPHERLYAANFVYQFALLSCLIGVINAPYTACVIAKEEMSFFAWISIIDSCLKLCVVFMLPYGGHDKLILYSFLLLVCSLIRFFVERLYCKRKIKECRYHLTFEKSKFYEILNFSFWNLFKMGAVIGVSQGNNILVNIFGGPIASAALGIANQVNGAVYSFMQNVQTAFNPQITKNYASGNEEDLRNLISRASKFSCYMLFLVALPFLVNTEFILDIWLNQYPKYAINLCRFAILSILMDALTGPFTTAILATGKIKMYQLSTSILWFLSIPLAWFLLKYGISIEYIFAAKIVAQVLVLIESLRYLKGFIRFSIKDFVMNILIKTILIFGIIYITLRILSDNLLISNIYFFLISIITTIILLGILVLYFGMTKNERAYIITIIKEKFN